MIGAKEEMNQEVNRTTVVIRRLTTLAAIVLAMVALAAPAAFAKTFTVNSTNNPGSGVCDATECTLKEAVNEASGNGETDTINFAAGLSGEIPLADTPGGGGFSIQNDTPAEDLTINGPGAGVLAVNGNDATRAFGIASGANATINGLTIKRGKAPGGDPNGGGISNSGTLTLNNSTVSGNSAGGAGSGIFNYFGGTLTLTNSTVSGNGAASEGGGIFISLGAATLTHATLTGNSAPTGANLFIEQDAGNPVSTNLGATILTNLLGGGTNCAGPPGAITSQGSNLEFPGASCGAEVQSNPLLAPLANNGGPTPTHALQPGSAAIDRVATGCPPPATDQRGVGRPLDGDGNGSKICDIGAFKKAPPPTAPVARPDFFRVLEDRLLVVPAPGVLKNDSDANGDRLSARRVTRTKHGTLTLRANGSLVYNSKRDFNGVDTFYYRAFDGKALSNQAKVTIRVVSRPG
jgi:hypothetical protein